MKKLQLLIIAIFLMVPALAFAQAVGAPAAQDPVAYQLIGHAMELAGALLMLVATWATHKLSGWLQKKTGIDTDALLTSYAEKGVNYAEEKAHQYLDAHKTALTGPQKLEIALDFVMDLANQNKLPQWAQDKLVHYIEAKLGATRSDSDAAEALNTPVAVAAPAAPVAPVTPAA